MNKEHWSVDTTELKKDPEQYAIWQLEQRINFGLNGQKLDTNLLKKYWDRLSIDQENREFLHFLLWKHKDIPSLHKSK